MYEGLARGGLASSDSRIAAPVAVDLPRPSGPEVGMTDGTRRYTFGRAMRLGQAREFAAVYNARCRKTVGPLVVHGRPNALPHPRLGLSVGRKVGTAVARNRIKRLVREAFRRMQHDLPRGYDLVVVVRPHEALALAAYQHLLHKAVRQIHQEWDRRETSPAN